MMWRDETPCTSSMNPNLGLGLTISFSKEEGVKVCRRGTERYRARMRTKRNKDDERDDDDERNDNGEKDERETQKEPVKAVFSR